MQPWRLASLCVCIFVLTLALVSCGSSPAVQMAQSTPSTQPSSTPISNPTPVGATVIDNIEDVNKWLTCGACGNGGGTGAIANYSATVGMASPSEDGSATQFSIAASVPYTNGYFYQAENPVHAQIGLLQYEFDLYIPSGSENAPQALEFECQQALNGWIYNFSWQADYASNVWRIFNYGAKVWESANVPLQRFTPGTWHHIVAEYHNDVASHSVFHDALTVDGVRTPVNIRHDAFFSGAANDQFTNAFQLDSNSVPLPYSVFLDRMKVTYK